MLNPKTSTQCPYCHEFTFVQGLKKEIKLQSRENITIFYVWEEFAGEVWWMGVCNNCEKPLLILNIGQQVFPRTLPASSDERIPEKIRKDFDEAKICFSVQATRACAAMARRTIEMICIDQGASEDDKLVQQIKYLADNGIITVRVKKWADAIRWVGNDAIHSFDEEVSIEDAEEILELAGQLLHIIYITQEIAEEIAKKKGKI